MRDQPCKKVPRPLVTTATNGASLPETHHDHLGENIVGGQSSGARPASGLSWMTQGSVDHSIQDVDRAWRGGEEFIQESSTESSGARRLASSRAFTGRPKNHPWPIASGARLRSMAASADVSMPSMVTSRFNLSASS